MDLVGPGADWRNADAYAPLLDADRSIFGWEWLRRDPGYRAAAIAGLSGPGKDGDPPDSEVWGLHEFELPHLAAPAARPVWRADIHALVLTADANPPGAPADRFDLAFFGPMTRLIGADASERLLISDGLHVVRIDIREGSIARGPVQLRYLLAGVASAEGPLLALRRLLALCRSGRFSRSLHPREVRARRWILTLRAFDGLAAGADQREIAAILLSPVAGEPRWRSNASSLRSQVQRLVRSTRLMAAGGYRELLR